MTAITALGTIPTPTSALELWYGIAGPISARSPRDVGYIISAISRAVLSLSLFTTVYMIGTIGMLIGNLNATAVTFRKKLEALDVFIVKKGAEIAPRSRRDRAEIASRLNLGVISQASRPSLARASTAITCAHGRAAWGTTSAR